MRDLVRFLGCLMASSWNKGPIVVGNFLVVGAGGTIVSIGMVERVERIPYRQLHVLRNGFSALKLQNPHFMRRPRLRGLSCCSLHPTDTTVHSYLVEFG